MNTAKYWTGRIGDCDICKAPLETDFFDARTVGGPWATMCKPCFHFHGSGKLGTGHGQHYQRQLDKRWLKVAG